MRNIHARHTARGCKEAYAPDIEADALRSQRDGRRGDSEQQLEMHFAAPMLEMPGRSYLIISSTVFLMSLHVVC
jgi:hypothetical protein